MRDRRTISVVIPSVGRPKALRDTLDELSRQHSEPLEVIVIAQDEITAEMMGRYVTNSRIDVVVKRLEEPNASLARNQGLEAARGDVVLFLDDDVRIENPRFLDAHLSNYRKPDVSGVAGQILPPNGKPCDCRHSRSHHPRSGWLYFPRAYNRRCRVREAPTGNLSVWRSRAVSVGGMDAQFERGAHREDSDFTLRLTEKYGPLVFDPEASLVHLGEPEGGCRSWGGNSGVHPLHHLTGGWYFLLKNLRAGRILIRDLPDHLFVLVRRQILNRANLIRPWRTGLAAVRSARGLLAAVRKLREGPRYLGKVGRRPMRSLRSERGTRR